MEGAVRTAIDAIGRLFAEAACDGFVHVRALADGAEIALGADQPVVMASTFKVFIALEVQAQASAGLLDLSAQIEISSAAHTYGSTGVSAMKYPVRLSLHDLCTLMLAVSDNAATDLLIARAGLENVRARAAACGCRETVIVSDLKDSFDDFAREMDFAKYADLFAAQNGAGGQAAKARATDQAKIDRARLIDPRQTSRTTPRDMTAFMASVWADRGAPAEACAWLREALHNQVARRMEGAVPDGGRLAAKSGSFLGRVRNEVGVITYPDNAAYAFAVFTRAHAPWVGTAAINAAMAQTVKRAIDALRA
jgi:beta-lactamase class A